MIGPQVSKLQVICYQISGGKIHVLGLLRNVQFYLSDVKTKNMSINKCADEQLRLSVN